MKSISFTDEELAHLRIYYQMELVEAEKDVERINDILSKLDASIPAKPEIVIEKVPGKRGRKPKAILEELLNAEPVKRGRKPKISSDGAIKKERKQRADKGQPRGKRVKLVIEESPISEPFVTMVEPTSDKPLIPKKAKKKKQPKRRGITLAPMGRPLPSRAPEPYLPPADEVQETAE